MELLMLVLVQALFMVVIKVIKMAMELMWVLLLEATYPELLNKLILYLQEFAIIKANVLYLRQLQVSDGLSTTARRVAVPQLTLLTCRWVGRVSMYPLIIITPIYRAYSSPFVVGALFAHPTYDVRDQSDTIFKGLSGNPLLATEAKRAAAFPVSKLWHHGSRGIQTLCTLYRTGCPTILYSQKCFKVFVENDSRDAIFAWPFDSGNSNQNDEPYSRERVARSYTLQVMTSVIMQVITICLLACGEDDLISSSNPMAVEAVKMKPKRQIISFDNTDFILN
ncbi:hypothetical protein MIR68_003528 [Amoeboaphelidium protococcarum]|nr:hypothetical protein MIR68_003528 [Amoeboaphelidium protococcarum]